MTDHQIDVYFDYTCPFANRARLWLDQVDVPLRWRPFSLLEANRDDDGPPVWERPELSDNISLLALAGHEATIAVGGDPDRYRQAFFEAWHHTDRRLGRGDVVSFAVDAGADEGSIDLAAGLKSVGEEHVRAVGLGVFGSPTLIFPNGAGRYVRITDLPADGAALLDRIEALADAHPELDELKATHPSRRGARADLLAAS